MASMKLVMEDGKEIAVDDLQAVIIGKTQKVIIYMPTLSLCDLSDLSVSKIFESFDSFFGESKWLLTSTKLQLEAKDGQ